MERMILKCSDFESLSALDLCCLECKAAPELKTTVYPRSGIVPKAPDLGMGIRAEVCCRHIHIAQKAKREWWYEKYLRGSGRLFLESEIQRALSVTYGDKFYQVFGEIHQAARAREQGRLVKQPLKTQRTGLKKCPDCGSNWNEIVCETCGFTV
jgi:hypothetical protein